MKKNIILDVNYHFYTNTLILAIMLLRTGKVSIKTINLDYRFTKTKRDAIVDYFNTCNIYVFKEGIFIDDLLQDKHFENDKFILSKNQIKELKRKYSSEKDWNINNIKIDNIISKNFIEFYPKYQSGDLKVLGLFNNIKQDYSMFSTLESAIDYNKVNLSIIFYLYSRWIQDPSCFGKLKNIKNCYGNLICINGTCVISPRIIKVKSAWLSSDYFYFTTENKKNQVKNLQEFTLNFINENKGSQNWQEKFKNKVNQIIKQYDII